MYQIKYNIAIAANYFTELCINYFSYLARPPVSISTSICCTGDDELKKLFCDLRVLSYFVNFKTKIITYIKIQTFPKLKDANMSFNTR